MIRYQHRLIYATDLEVNPGTTTAQRNKSAHERWISNWQFFATADSMRIPQVEGAFKGLRLPRGVIENIYYNNAIKWFPGLQELKRN